MHIPDGFIDAKTAIISAGLAAAGLGVALRSLKKTLPPARVPLMGLSAAFIFAAQMINFPVAGGTSGHLIGATLAAVALGPSAAVVVLATVLILQCLMFADGGVTALGANVFNMAVAAPLVGYGVFRMVRAFAGNGLRGMLFGAAFGAWCSTVAASILCAGQLAFSGTTDWRLAFPAMIWIHMLIGIGEAVITALALSAIVKVRPEILEPDCTQAPVQSFFATALLGLIFCAGIALFVAPFASPWPDGLEKVASVLGFEQFAMQKSLMPAPLPDYKLPSGVPTVFSTGIAGLVGAVVAFVLAYIFAASLTRAKGSGNPKTTDQSSDGASA
jgi:cobalt/nickel transport system permease protein